MAGDVEMAQPEREIDRVEIFERRGKERQVRREEDECDDARVVPNAECKMRGVTRSYILHCALSMTGAFLSRVAAAAALR